jgi:epoxyqueuosine reductase
MPAAILAEEIRNEALALGFEKCAMVPLPSLAGFAAELERRIGLIPQDDFTEKDMATLSNLSRFNRLPELFPWAKSAVICVVNYGVYRIPGNLPGRVAKMFCVDCRLDANSREWRASAALEGYMAAKGLRFETERKYGLVPLRWAAGQAGLGRVRKNNFFYTESGSWVSLEAWLVDRELELRGSHDLGPCPEGCRLCREACPTGALAGEFLTRPGLCVTSLNAIRPTDWVGHPFAGRAGEWVYGCDACQDACPLNQGKWRAEEEFPGLSEISGLMDPGMLVGLGYDSILENLVPKFWFVTADRPWQWKTNALNAMKNAWVAAEREPYVRMALNDESPEVRRMAEWVLGLGDRKA